MDAPFQKWQVHARASESVLWGVSVGVDKTGHNDPAPQIDDLHRSDILGRLLNFLILQLLH
eukprot:13236-Eustigmatos_ZCMA.PRE.1